MNQKISELTDQERGSAAAQREGASEFVAAFHRRMPANR